MEGVGARFGRSSTRYGPATVFNGPVRKWKKRWVHASPSNNNHHSHHLQHYNINVTASSTTTSSSSNGNSLSHLLFYKWTPLSQSDGNTNDNTFHDPPHPNRKFKYIPVALLEKQKEEAAEKEITEKEAAEKDGDTKQTDVGPHSVEPIPKSDAKPDINNRPMDEIQVIQDDNQVVQQDLNESTLDLSLGLKCHENDSDSKPGQPSVGQLQTLKSSRGGT